MKTLKDSLYKKESHPFQQPLAEWVLRHCNDGDNLTVMKGRSGTMIRNERTHVTYTIFGVHQPREKETA